MRTAGRPVIRSRRYTPCRRQAAVGHRGRPEIGAGFAAHAFPRDDRPNRRSAVPGGQQRENPPAGTRSKQPGGGLPTTVFNSLCTGCPEIAAGRTLARRGFRWHQYSHSVHTQSAHNRSRFIVLVEKLFRACAISASAAIMACAAGAAEVRGGGDGAAPDRAVEAGHRTFGLATRNPGCCTITVSAVEDRVRMGRSRDPFAATLVRERARHRASCGHPGIGRASSPPPGWLVHFLAWHTSTGVNASLTIIALNEAKNTHRLRTTRSLACLLSAIVGSKRGFHVSS